MISGKNLKFYVKAVSIVKRNIKKHLFLRLFEKTYSEQFAAKEKFFSNT